jgi:hypothetical protein
MQKKANSIFAPQKNEMKNKFQSHGKTKNKMAHNKKINRKIPMS